MLSPTRAPSFIWMAGYVIRERRGRGAGIRTLNEGFGDPSDSHFTTPLRWFVTQSF